MFWLKSGRPVTRRFYRKEPSPVRIIATRLFYVMVILLTVATIFWGIEKDHIEDSADDEFSYIDSLYFTVVTVTTLGYGDIVPVTEEARLFDAVIITPVRMIVWVLFIGTAYQLMIQRFWEWFRMSRALKRMRGHVVIAGYGTTGVATVEELRLRGYDENSLVVIDPDRDKVKRAAQAGATGILGDPSEESTLEDAGIKGCGTMIITTPHDDANVLITLTARDLNPKLRIISRVSRHENIKQLKRAGADQIISPSLTSANLMAIAVSDKDSVEMIGNLLTTSRGVNLAQRKAKAAEIGGKAKGLKGCVVIGVVRKGKVVGPRELDRLKVRKGDELILIE